jgi:hypothetical protein
MSRYERAFETDWEELDEDEAVDRAYALGVAASLGEYHPDELEAVRDEADSAYARSLIDLAFDEGKNEGETVDAEAEEDDEVWNDLVSGEKVTVKQDEIPTGGRSGLPEAIDVGDVLDLPDVDRTEAIDLPEFLERE